MRPLFLLILLAGCGAEEAREPRNAAKAQTPAAAVRVPTAAEIEDMEAAAATLGAYYAHLGQRDYRSAWALREQRPGLSYERFAASFDIYADYNAGVGSPSYPAAADGWVWIDAPVQTWGRRKDGGRFGNVGRVLLKRRAGSSDWKISP